MDCIKPSHDIFEKLRDKFLASIFTEEYSRAEAVYTRVAEETIMATELSENQQKTINQMQQAFTRFLPEIKKNCTKEILSIHKKLRKYITGIVRNSSKNNTHIDFYDWKNKTGLNDKLLRTIFKSATTLQITTGCSNFCRRCNEWAIPGPRKHFSYDAVTHFTKKIFNENNPDFVYYGASDPLDWQDKNRDIISIINYLADNKFKPRYGFLTKAPLGKEKLLEKMININADLSISVTARNRKRIKNIEKRVGKSASKQHDVDELLIPACFDEDFSSVKSTITDNYGVEITPEGAFITLPAFTSALNLTGQHRIPVTPETRILPVRKTGRTALSVIYFKPLEVIDLNGKTFKLKKLLPVQVENLLLDVDSYEVTPPGMMNIKEYFKTFEKDAALRRKKIFPSVAKKIKEECLKNSCYKTSPYNQRKSYKHRVSEYLKFCRPHHVENFKIHSFSFFLKSISHYLKYNPDRRKIILNLRKKDKKLIYEKLKTCLNTKKIGLLITNPEIDAYDLFQLLYFRLLDSPCDKAIKAFIMETPSRYDDATDMFCPASL